ncbi:MAG TPA: hypothetical protein VFU02_24115 [Polyangiaceae bacterium]|nr:hypothetical protein [Polyangiaceae bacterium]
MVASALAKGPLAYATDWEPGNRTTAPLPGEVGSLDAGNAVDGVYGRFDGDVDLALSLGAELESDVERLLVAASAHYFWTAGVYGTFREAMGDDSDEVQTRRLFSVGVDVRPLFVPRWSLDLQTGPATLDLMLDSISMSAGAYFAPADEGARRRGFETTFGAGIPLTGAAAGPWLSARYDVRWPEAGDASTSVWLMLSWHVLVSTPLVSNTGARALGTPHRF